MKITLKNLKYAAFASTDSNCFEATVYVDGVRAFTASDDGHGGCMNFHPLNGIKGSRKLLHQALAYAVTLPPCDVDIGGGKRVPLDMDLELLVGELVEDELERREYKKHAAKGVAFIEADNPNTIRCYPFPKALPKTAREALRNNWINNNLRTKHPTAVFIAGDGRRMDGLRPHLLNCQT